MIYISLNFLRRVLISISRQWRPRFRKRYTNLTINFARLYAFAGNVVLNVTSVTIACSLNFYLGCKQGHWEATSNICREKLARVSRQSPFFPTALEFSVFAIADVSSRTRARSEKVNLTISLSAACDFIIRIVCVGESPVRKSAPASLISRALITRLPHASEPLSQRGGYLSACQRLEDTNDHLSDMMNDTFLSRIL